jgi:Flp pilus assembly protein TadD
VRRLLLAILLVGYAGVFVGVPSFARGGRAFEPLDTRGRDVERAIEQGRFADALPFVQALSVQHENDPTLAYWTAEIYRGLTQHAAEAAAWERVFDLTHTADAACPALARAYESAGDETRALDAYQRCASAAADDPERWLDLGRAYATRGMAADADAAFEKVRALDPFHPALTRWAAPPIQANTGLR